MSKGHILGIDIGGSGIKGAPVDLEKGEFAEDRKRIDTPEDSTPEAVAEVVAEVAEHFKKDMKDDAPVGITVPAVVHHGIVRSAANIDPSWIGTDAEALFSKVLDRRVIVINDADAAGAAEMHYGAGRGHEGTVLLTTLGTGIGTALFLGGELMPNTELGHLELDGYDAEKRAASSIRENEDLSWEDWAERLQRYYSHVEDLLWPDLIVVGGGVSKKADKFLPLLHLRAPIVPAQLRNDAGIIGAAWLASHHRS
ncbi:polyphosphate--glucose phosphotransferase [Ornithinimicrobium sp. INDO-MA30-4]|uniref:polyphosphate--glucose phosphotransferase n=1 Tax=Ornithinimicrobium sp. INDO-MA30-4 TaxID=2908651 RepID=UPI001F1D8A6D|nr:ROK family protein [Ornithinimicrobium sp. INDO-MA30-4]UJH70948.1 ROK family protein [Ornithinimicrobium sp. INDO-MA30-4]